MNSERNTGPKMPLFLLFLTWICTFLTVMGLDLLSLHWFWIRILHIHFSIHILYCTLPILCSSLYSTLPTLYPPYTGSCIALALQGFLAGFFGFRGDFSSFGSKTDPIFYSMFEFSMETRFERVVICRGETHQNRRAYIEKRKRKKKQQASIVFFWTPRRGRGDSAVHPSSKDTGTFDLGRPR